MIYLTLHFLFILQLLLPLIIDSRNYHAVSEPQVKSPFFPYILRESNKIYLDLKCIKNIKKYTHIIGKLKYNLFVQWLRNYWYSLCLDFRFIWFCTYFLHAKFLLHSKIKLTDYRTVTEQQITSLNDLCSLKQD